MAEGARMTAAQVADKLLSGEHADVLRQSVAWMVAELMEAEVAAQIGAELGQRTPDRVAQRNGYRPRAWDTRVGELELRIPRLRTGSYFPSFLEPRRRAEQALVAVVQEADVNGVSTRRVDRLVEQLGVAGMSKDQVSRLCRGLDEQVRAFRERPLEGRYPYLWLDAKVDGSASPAESATRRWDRLWGSPQRPPRGHRPGRGGGRDRGVLAGVPARLARPGLQGVRLCVADAHDGLRQVIAKVLGWPWQRCSVHFLRDMLGHVAKAQQPMIAAAIRGIFQAASLTEARQRLIEVVDRLGSVAPKVARLLEAAQAELLAFYQLPREHWSKLRSTNPLERVNREIGRRTDVVGIFPNDAALLRLASALLIEQNDEWLVTRRYLSQESLELVLDNEPATQEVAQLTPA
jgi:putative transposase